MTATKSGLKSGSFGAMHTLSPISALSLFLNGQILDSLWGSAYGVKPFSQSRLFLCLLCKVVLLFLFQIRSQKNILQGEFWTSWLEISSGSLSNCFCVSMETSSVLKRRWQARCLPATVGSTCQSMGGSQGQNYPACWGSLWPGQLHLLEKGK